MAINETGYNDWELLQDTLRSIHNRIVRAEFNDVSDDDSWDDDPLIGTGRAKLRVACFMKDTDSATTTLLRMMLFYVILRKASDFQTPIYGIPVPEYQEKVKFRPQIRLYFAQDADSVPENEAPTTAEISFRLMNETSTTLTESDLRTIGLKIKSEFGASGGYRWRKGKVIASYRDAENGCQFILYAYSESEAKEVIEKVLDIVNKTPDWSHLKISTAAVEPVTNQGVHTVLGKSRKKPRKMPIAYVRFVYASCSVWGLPNDVILYDRSGFKNNVLVS